MAGTQLREKSAICKNCGISFTYSSRTGAPKLHCSDTCRVAYQVSRRLPRELWNKCSTDGCTKTVRAQSSSTCNACYASKAKKNSGLCTVHKCTNPAVRVGHGLCEKHYDRVRRVGSTELAPRVVLKSRSGYTLVKDPGHPLSNANGWLAQHRVVAYEKYGAGDHPCHWCGVVLPWPDIVIDHLNEVKTDNAHDNLVVACSPCNRMRGAMIPFISRMKPERMADFIATFEHMRSSYLCEEAQ